MRSTILLSLAAGVASLSLHDLSATTMSGASLSLSLAKGKVALMVNVASRCGFTDAVYKQLTKWHATYGEKIEILLYPSDEFGGQELPSKAVPDFVKGKGLPTDGGGCHLMQKAKVNGPDADPAWTFAKIKFPGDVNWNFHGIFIFDTTGETVGRYTPSELPSVDLKLRSLLLDAKLIDEL